MKVVQINSVLNSGSTGRIVEGIGLQLLASGHQSIAVWGRRSMPSQSVSFRIGNKLGIALHGLKSMALDRHGLGSKRATHGLVKRMRELKPDLVQLHNIHGYYINYPVLFDYLKETEVPVVWTLHDNWSFTGHCSNSDRFNCEKWKTQCSKCPMTRYYPKAYIDNSAGNHRAKKKAFLGLKNATIVTPCRWLADLVRQSFLGAYPVRVIHNGIDLSQFAPAEVSDEESIVVGVANVWPESKGLRDFCQLRSLLPNEIRIVLIGLSEQQIRSLPAGIEGIRRTESIRELAQWYSRATALVCPTYSDTFPTTNLESLACGTPVVTYKTGGGPEALTPETGMVVERGNVSQIAQAILKLANSRSQERRRLCRQRAVEKFSATDRFADYVKLYDQILGVKSIAV
jgi:putative colanic acid biosynthesis glycosyltransferase